MTIGSVRPPRDSEVSIESDASATGADTEEASALASRGFDRRKRIVLSCVTCGGRNYRKTKARREGAPPIQLMKFCATCNAHTLHREAV